MVSEPGAQHETGDQTQSDTRAGPVSFYELLLAVVKPRYRGNTCICTLLRIMQPLQHYAIGILHTSLFATHVIGLCIACRAEEQFSMPTQFESRYLYKRALRTPLNCNLTISPVIFCPYLFVLHRTSN
jgi:hypothetical protein